MKNKATQFRIQYYDFDDSELYTIIQVAPNESLARLRANERLMGATVNGFRITDVVELGAQHYINEIRKILTNA